MCFLDYLIISKRIDGYVEVSTNISRKVAREADNAFVHYFENWCTTIFEERDVSMLSYLCLSI